MFYLPGRRSHSPLPFGNRRLHGRLVDEFDNPELRSLLMDPDRLCSSPGAEILKQDRRSTVVRLTAGGVSMVVKQNHGRSLVKELKRAFAPSRAARAWHAAHTVEALDIDTAAPIAYIERRYGCFRGRSWLVLQSLPGPDARQYLTDPETPDSERERIIDAIVGIYRRMHAANFTHGDNRPQNFVIVDGRPHVIDLDVAILHPRWSPVRRRYMRRDIRRLLSHWQHQYPGIEAGFRAAFKRHGMDGGA